MRLSRALMILPLLGINGAGCLSITPNVTTMTVLPANKQCTSLDCSVGFGSSNDTSMLRLYQTDGYGTALANTAIAAQTGAALTMNEVYAVGGGGAAWLVGDSGKIASTTDGSASAWVDRSAAFGSVANDLMDLDVVSSQIVIAGGKDALIKRTDDGGATWTTQTSCVTGVGKDVQEIDYIDSNNGGLVGASGIVGKTTSGGTKWTAPAGAYGITNDVRGVEVVDATRLGGLDRRQLDHDHALPDSERARLQRWAEPQL